MFSMLTRKILIALALMPLLLTMTRPAASQLLSDAYGLAETKADIPADWVARSDTNDNQRGESARTSDHYWTNWPDLWWIERPGKPKQVPPRNHIHVSSRIMVSLGSSAEAVRSHLKGLLEHLNMSPVQGSYSGKPLGDLCWRGQKSGSGAFLYICRANAFFMVDVGGREGINYPDVAEKIARILLVRADAALALAGSEGGASTTSIGSRVGPRQPQGISVILVDEWAANGPATWQADWKAGTATVKQGNHTLRLMVGRRDALLDGKPLILPFPALRHGKDRLWCPIAVLSKLTG